MYGFVWFTGVVENRNDPAKLDFVQVRCLGYHTEDLNDIPSADLGRHVMRSSHRPIHARTGKLTYISYRAHGSLVFFVTPERNNNLSLWELYNVPQTSADSSIGFNDSNGKYPGTISHSNHTTGESDVSRLARE